MDIKKENNEGVEVSVSQFVKENKVSSDDFFNKLVPKLKIKDYNNVKYDRKFLNGLIKGE